jgi:hypothetical protein
LQEVCSTDEQKDVAPQNAGPTDKSCGELPAELDGKRAQHIRLGHKNGYEKSGQAENECGGKYVPPVFENGYQAQKVEPDKKDRDRPLPLAKVIDPEKGTHSGEDSHCEGDDTKIHPELAFTGKKCWTRQEAPALACEDEGCNQQRQGGKQREFAGTGQT